MIIWIEKYTHKNIINRDICNLCQMSSFKAVFLNFSLLVHFHKILEFWEFLSEKKNQVNNKNNKYSVEGKVIAVELVTEGIQMVLAKLYCRRNP